jgi:hypothetical protein
VQETDHFASVRGARIVLLDDDGVRAAMTGSWLAQTSAAGTPRSLSWLADSALSRAVSQPICASHEPVIAARVRSPEEYAAGHYPGSLSAPGGQLVQETDHFASVRLSWLADSALSRAVSQPICASHEPVIAARTPSSSTPPAEEISPAQLAQQLEEPGTVVLDFTTSANFVASAGGVGGTSAAGTPRSLSWLADSALSRAVSQPILSERGVPAAEVPPTPPAEEISPAQLAQQLEEPGLPGPGAAASASATTRRGYGGRQSWRW